MNGNQRCVDDDPRCDFDAGAPGSCTFAVRVCANNTDLPACAPGTRLATWTLVSPSETLALHSPAYARVRAAFAALVPAAIIGPTTRDVCSPFVPVEVPLRGVAPAYRAGKLELKAVAAAYNGSKDKDVLKLTCLPAAAP